MNQADVTCELFKLPVDLQRAILFIDKKVLLSLLSDKQIQNIIVYGQQQATLNPNYPNTANNKIEFLQRIGTCIRYGFFAAGEFIPPEEKTTMAINNNKNHLTSMKFHL